MSANASLQLKTPSLGNPDIIRDRIRRCSTHQVFGRIESVVGDQIEASGIAAPLGSICQIESADQPLMKVIGFRDEQLILAPLQRITTIMVGDTIRLVSEKPTIQVGSSLCGRVVDAFGNPLDGEPLPKDLFVCCADAEPPPSYSRPPIDHSLQTGVRAIDSLLTCGQGQRMGIFAGSGVGKSTLLGMLARGTSADRIVVALVGERGREVQEFIQRCLGPKGLERSVVVVATSDAPAAQRVAAASTATGIAEHFRDQGENVLLLVDSVTRCAMAQRELGLAAGEPPTTRGYPPSVFNMLPRLVERAGKTSLGSITAFYTVLVEGDDPNEPIADALRGLLDGHIVLDRNLANQNHWPPINVLESRSRVQTHIVDREILDSCNQIRQWLSDFDSHKDLISIGAYQSGSNSKIDAAIKMRDLIQEFLRQSSEQTVDIEQTNHLLQQITLN